MFLGWSVGGVSKGIWGGQGDAQGLIGRDGGS